MAKKVINVGITANDTSGDPLRAAGKIINENFTELYSILGGESGAPLSIVSKILAGKGILVSSPNGDVLVTTKIASADEVGGIRIGAGISVDEAGVANVQTYELPKASSTILGGIRVGDRLSINAQGVLSADAGAYSLPKATASALGGIKIGAGLSIDGGGIVSVSNSNRLIAGPSEVVLDADGDLSIPGTITSGQPVKIIGGGNAIEPNNNYVQLQWASDVANPDNGKNQYIWADADGAHINTSKFGTEGIVYDNQWWFKNDGVFQLPDGGDIVDSTGTTVLGGGLGDITVEVSEGYTSLTVVDKDFDLVTTRSNPGQDADIGIYAADDVWIEAGGDDVTITAANEVKIQTNAADNTYTWLYGADGALTLPGSIEINGDTNQLTENLNILNIELSGKQGQIGSLQGQIGSLQSQLSYYQSVISSGPQNPAFAEASGSIGPLSSQLAGLQGQLSVLQGELVTLQNQISVLNLQIANASASLSVNANDSTLDLSIANNNWKFGANGALAYPNVALQRDTATVQCLGNTSTVVYTGSGSYQHTIKLLIQVEGFEGAATQYDTQSCEMIIAKSFRGPTVATTVYAIVYTSAAPLATFTAEWNELTSRVEVRCTSTSANDVYVRTFVTEITTSD